MRLLFSSVKHTHPVSVLNAVGQHDSSTLFPTKNIRLLSAAWEGRGDAPTGAAEWGSVEAHPEIEPVETLS